ncbi:MAG: ABC transporter substrate-binding protein [Hyphomicrobiaceae bacterium]
MLVIRRLLMAAVCGLIMSPSALTSQAVAQSKFVFANASPYDTLDPHQILDVGRVASRVNLYDGLLRWLDNPAKLEPWLAESYTVSDDGKAYTFKLRKGAKFHDGSEIKAADVVYSMERILGLKGQSFPLFSDLVQPGSTKAADDYTVVFNLTKASAIFLAVVPEVHVVNTALVKKNEKDGDWGKAWLSKNAAGSGSYKLKRYDPAIGFTADRFKEHWNTKWGAKPIEEIEFRTVIELNSRVLGLIKGDFHGTDGYLPQDQIKRMRETPSLYVAEAESMRIFYSIIHSGREPMNDINFRKALSHAFDYDGFNKNILSDSVARNPVPLPNNIWGAPKGVKGYTYDLDKAKEYLAKMKSPPREITIGALAGYQQTEQAAALLQASLAKIGIKSKILAEPWSVVSTKMRNEQQMPDLLFLWKSTYYADPNNWVGEMYACDQIGQRNNSWYCNKEVDALLTAALATTDQAKRAANYEKAATMVMEDAGGIFIYNTKWFGPFNKKVTGVRFCPIGDGQEMRWASME